MIASTVCRVLGLTIQNEQEHEKESERKLYDESYRRMDGWMGGRRHVDLGGGRPSRGGPAGRRDYQAVQEITMRPLP